LSKTSLFAEKLKKNRRMRFRVTCNSFTLSLTESPAASEVVARAAEVEDNATD